MHGEMRNAHTSFVGKSEGKIQLGKQLRLRCEHNIKYILIKYGVRM
jgi:hypothetical protein